MTILRYDTMHSFLLLYHVENTGKNLHVYPKFFHRHSPPENRQTPGVRNCLVIFDLTNFRGLLTSYAVRNGRKVSFHKVRHS